MIKSQDARKNATSSLVDGADDGTKLEENIQNDALQQAALLMKNKMETEVNEI